MMINYDDMSIEELKNLCNELEEVINDRVRANRIKAIEKADKLIEELNSLMTEYELMLEVADWDDNCVVRTDEITRVIK